MRRPSLLTVAAGALLAGVSLTACATPDPNRPSASADADADGPGASSTTTTGTYTASGTVLESPEHGPMLCLVVQTSYPPQCGDLELVGWDWDAVDDETSVNGTTWGGPYGVTGTWDGERLTLTEPPGPPAFEPSSTPDLSTPCPEPPGGWKVVDPSTTNDDTLIVVTEAAYARPDFAGLWLDQPIRGPLIEGYNDPTNLIVNVRVTGDVAAAEQDLRQIWGGALCVLPAERSQAELSAIQMEIMEQSAAIRMIHGGIDSTTGLIEIGVVFDDGTLQARFDEQYGVGVVRVVSWLQPA